MSILDQMQDKEWRLRRRFDYSIPYDPINWDKLAMYLTMPQQKLLTNSLALYITYHVNDIQKHTIRRVLHFAFTHKRIKYLRHNGCSHMEEFHKLATSIGYKIIIHPHDDIVLPYHKYAYSIIKNDTKDKLDMIRAWELSDIILNIISQTPSRSWLKNFVGYKPYYTIDSNGSFIRLN